MTKNKDCLGDGVYAEHDGYHIILFTQDGNKIYLEPEVMEALKNYEKRVKNV